MSGCSGKRLDILPCELQRNGARRAALPLVVLGTSTACAFQMPLGARQATVPSKKCRSCTCSGFDRHMRPRC